MVSLAGDPVYYRDHSVATIENEKSIRSKIGNFLVYTALFGPPLFVVFVIIIAIVDVEQIPRLLNILPSNGMFWLLSFGGFSFGLVLVAHRVMDKKFTPYKSVSKEEFNCKSLGLAVIVPNAANPLKKHKTSLFRNLILLVLAIAFCIWFLTPNEQYELLASIFIVCFMIVRVGQSYRKIKIFALWQKHAETYGLDRDDFRFSG